VVYDLAKVGKALNLPSPIDDLQVTPGTSPRAQTVSALLDDETTATVRGNTLRSVLGLRSTWFTPQLLELVPPKKALPYGSAGTLTGFAHGVTDPITLEAKPTGGAWAPVGPLTPGADGALSTSVSPQLTTQYRLAVGKLRVALAKVGVAPVLSVQQAPTGLAGSSSPCCPTRPSICRCSRAASGRRSARRSPTAAERGRSAASSRPARTACAAPPATGSWPAVSSALQVS
jgi:hypothetical protein